jgi:hypothetical protein
MKKCKDDDEEKLNLRIMEGNMKTAKHNKIKKN